MIIRVPLLLQKAVAVIHRLDITSTWNVNPPGEKTTGYSHTFDEPIVYDTSEVAPNTRTSARTEMAAVRIPCQVEILTDEELRQIALGDDPITNLSLILHRRDLERLGLLDSNRDVLLKKGDRISCLERYGAASGTVVKSFANPGLYVLEVRSGSWGFGPDGYDLERVITFRRKEGN